jgi:hypothetical protein
MLPYVVLILAALFLVAKWAGLLDDIAAAARERQDHESERRTRRPRVLPRGGEDEERLEIYRDFLEGSSRDEEE